MSQSYNNQLSVGEGGSTAPIDTRDTNAPSELCGRYFLQQFSAGGLKGSGTVLGRLLEHNTDGNLIDDQLFLIAIHPLIAGNETTTNLLGGMFHQ
jgi:cytochrome P450